MQSRGFTGGRGERIDDGATTRLWRTQEPIGVALKRPVHKTSGRKIVFRLFITAFTVYYPAGSVRRTSGRKKPRPEVAVLNFREVAAHNHRRRSPPHAPANRRNRYSILFTNQTPRSVLMLG